MGMKETESLGMILDNWEHKSCTAMVGVGDRWATIYMIASDEQGKGHAGELLTEMKIYYEGSGYKFGSSIAINNRMKHLLNKLGIEEYGEDYEPAPPTTLTPK